MTVAQKPFQSWIEGIERVATAAAGVVEVQIVQSCDMADVLGDALAGDRQAIRLASTVSTVLQRIADAPRRARALCASCPRPLKRGRFSIVVCSPSSVKQPDEVLTLAVCYRFATDRAAVQDKALVGLRGIWPDVRRIVIGTSAGHA